MTESAGGDSSSQSAAGQGGEAPEAAGSAGAASACDASIDFKSDAKNCGSCGHDCLGGECDHGRCQPVMIVPTPTHASDIATDGTYLYWIGANADLTAYVARRRVDRSDAVTIIAPAETRAIGLALSASNVYWLGASKIRSCTTPNCELGPKDFASATSDCFKIHFSNAGLAPALLWTCQTVYKQNDGSFWSASILDAKPTHIQPISANPTGVTSDDENVYWANSSGFDSHDALKSDAAVWRLRLSDGSTTPIVSGFVSQFGKLAIGAGRLYFDDTNKIPYVPIPEGAPQPIKFSDASATGIGGLVANDRAVYWSNFAEQTVVRCAHQGCAAPEVLETDQPSIGDVAQDAVSVYWTSDRATVQRLAK